MGFFAKAAKVGAHANAEIWALTLTVTPTPALTLTPTPALTLVHSLVIRGAP